MDNKNGMNLFTEIYGSEKKVKLLPVMCFFFILLAGSLTFISNPTLKAAFAAMAVLIALGVTVFSIYRIIRFFILRKHR
ncbi:hypothetical protein [Anaerocolumna chitinilytica]|nr:hypothetical protein [Anaerocolumna chitinilytica]